MNTFLLVRSDEQIDEVARLAREIWTAHYVPIVGAGQIDYMLERFQSSPALEDQIADGVEYYLILHKGRNAGYLAVREDEDGFSLNLSKLYVREALRGRGLGKAMLAFAEDIAVRRGRRTLWLTVNKNNAGSIDWYGRMGFINTGECVRDIGGGFVMDDWRMEKKLT